MGEGLPADCFSLRLPRIFPRRFGRHRFGLLASLLYLNFRLLFPSTPFFRLPIKEVIDVFACNPHAPVGHPEMKTGSRFRVQGFSRLKLAS